jgi:drug/metabolite transporter (DMT)-like permease
MAVHLWSIGEAHRSKGVSSPSDVVGYGAGLLTWLLAAGVFIAGKAGAEEMPPWSFCFWRVFLAALILVPLVLGYLGEIRRFLRQRGIEALLIGGLGLGLTQGIMFTALGHTSALNAGIIFSTCPIVTLLLARIVLGEAMGPWQVLGSIVAFAGIVFITVRGDPELLAGLEFGIGDLLAITAAFTLSCYTVLLKRARFELERLPLLVVLMAGGAIASFPFFLYELVTGQHENLNVDGYLALAYTVTFGGALMYLCYNWSIDVLGATRAGVLLYSQMVFTAILAWLILGEAIEWYHYVGGGMIVAGIVLVTLLKREPVSVGT